MSKSNCIAIRPQTLTRTEAIACGAVFDLIEEQQTRATLIELGFEMPVGITYSAWAELLDTREILLALKSSLLFSLGQNTVFFLVPSETKDEPSIWLKAIREEDGLRPVLTIMTPSEGVTNP